MSFLPFLKISCLYLFTYFIFLWCLLTETRDVSELHKPKLILKAPSVTIKVVKKPVSSSIAKDQKEKRKQEEDPKASEMTTALQSLCQNYESDESNE